MQGSILLKSQDSKFGKSGILERHNV